MAPDDTERRWRPTMAPDDGARRRPTARPPPAGSHAKVAEHLRQQQVSPHHDQRNRRLNALAQRLEHLPARSRTALDRTCRDGAGRAELGAELGLQWHHDQDTDPGWQPQALPWQLRSSWAPR